MTDKRSASPRAQAGTIRHRNRSTQSCELAIRSGTSALVSGDLDLHKAIASRIQLRAPRELTPDPGNARTHSDKQILQIAASIREFGFNNPVLVDADDRIIAGHGRVEAAKQLGLEKVPTILIDHLSKAQRRAYVIADNRLAELAGWDQGMLAIELQYLSEIDLDFDVEITGFETAEIDLMIEGLETGKTDDADQIPNHEADRPAVTRIGDLWLLGHHRLLCGDARDEACFECLMAGESAQMVFADPPYNVPIDGHVSGLGRMTHREFVMGSGEMSEEAFQTFLQNVLSNHAAASVDGALLYFCMDWRHLLELLQAARSNHLALMNVCVWNKSNGGMGSFYRSKHELVPVFKKGKVPHINTIELGSHGRYRTNVWDYAGVNAFGANRLNDLKMHPTVKPTALVGDAIKDCTRRGDIVLDGFAGSGTTLISAEKTGRIGYGLDLDPQYVDTAVRRWERQTGKKAIHAETRLTLEELTKVRRLPSTSQPDRSSNAECDEGEELDHDK